ALSAGSQIAILGLEGTRPYEVLAVALGSGDAAALSLALAQATPTTPPTPPPPPSTPPAGLVPPAPAAPAPMPSPRLEEGRPGRGEEGRSLILRGTVYGVAGQNLFIKKDDGALVMVDISKLGPSTALRLRTGSPVAVVAIPVGNKFLATGFTEPETDTS